MTGIDVYVISKHFDRDQHKNQSKQMNSPPPNPERQRFLVVAKL
jgi:hypothetical protein